MNTSEDYSEIYELDLSNQSLKQLPTNIGEYTNLKELDISGNSLEELPECLKELQYLEKLNISYNPLDEIPSWLWKLTELKNLNISGLNLGDLPVEVGGLKKLEVLIANETKIKSLPESIGYLKNLKELSLKNNELERLPKTFSHLKKLNKINFRLNKFKVIPTDIFNFLDVAYLNISANSISTVPKEIGFLKKLSYLNISHNKIKNVPEALGTLKLKHTHFHYKNNPFSRAALGNIKRSFAQEKEVKPIQKKRVKTNPEKKVENTFSSRQKEKLYAKQRQELIEKKNKTELVFFIIIITVIAVFVLIKITRKDSGVIEVVEERLSPNELIKKEEKERFQRIIKRMEYVSVYTNDKAYLHGTIRPNIPNEDAVFDDTSNDEIANIKEFLENKSYGYNIHLNNSRGKMENVMRIYDSIIPSDVSKKFVVLAYYKMTRKEKKLQSSMRQLDSGDLGYRDAGYDDYAVSSGVFSFVDLTKENAKNKLSDYKIPQNINLNRKDYYFYFFPYNDAISKEEFSEAVEKFKETFIEKGNPDKFCVLKEIKIMQD